MDELTLARLLHVVGVVLWIGGVAFVTTTLLPGLREALPPADRLTRFHDIERRFAWQARGTTLLTGASGLWMIVQLDAWDRYLDPAFWWMHAMTAIWLVFSVMLFVLEPLWLDAWLRHRATADPDGTWRLIQRLHWLLLSLSLITVAGAVAGVHG